MPGDRSSYSASCVGGDETRCAGSRTKAALTMSTLTRVLRHKSSGRRRISCVRQTMRSSLTFALTLCLLVAPAMVIAQPQMPHYPAEYSYNMTATIGIVSATINSWNGESDYRIFPRPSYSAFQMISMVGCALIPSSRARGRRSFNSSQKAK